MTRSPKPRKPRKPASLPPSEHLDMAESYLALAARHIDTAGDLAANDRADMLACYASNVLQGSLALIREFRQALKQTKERGKPGGGE